MDRLMPIRWWHWFPRRTWRVVGQVEAADRVPAKIPRNGIILSGPAEAPTWLAFDCPCRTGHRVLVNLDRRRRPYWSLVQRTPLSIWPSFDVLGTERRCHFVVRDGRVSWVHNRKDHHD